MNKTPKKKIEVKNGDALLLVDMQNDFFPHGSLAVPGADDVVSPANRYIKIFIEKGLPVLYTRDWHPENHVSFKHKGGLWPSHCVAGTKGADFHPQLNIPDNAQVISKAVEDKTDAYSGFQNTDLDSRLTSGNTKRIFIGGLATDYCVKNSVLDALGLGYKVFLLCDAIRAVDVEPGDGQKAVEEMKKNGAFPITLETIG